ncbi:sensor histidine kinase [Kineococcus sp. R86509]|uniref:sensor histidine kinase n=1 Tax=Kineococcus sp. R86509 TaxID=3093851 RepID=UPI0036D32951
MVTPTNAAERPATPPWIRRPLLPHALAYGVAALVFAAQLAAVVVTGAGWPTAFAVLLAGGGVALSWWWPWCGLVVASAAPFAVTVVGRDPLSVWMTAVLVLFSVTLRGRNALAGTVVTAVCFLAALMTVGAFRGGAFAGSAALFSAVAGGVGGAALRLHREHWWTLEEQAAAALAAREVDVTRRVTEERLRIARDLHDVVGHQVAMLNVHLGVAEIGLPPDAERSRQALVSARSSAATVVVETQRILALLRRGDEVTTEEALRPTPGLSSLSGLVESFEAIGLDVEPSLQLADGAAEPSLGVTVYRVVQEALTNAHRHGTGPTTVDVRATTGRISVTVENGLGQRPRNDREDDREDDAAGGPSTAVPRSGMGLVGMRERVESAGGRLRVGPVGQRFRVHAEFGPVGTGPR